MHREISFQKAYKIWRIVNVCIIAAGLMIPWKTFLSMCANVPDTLILGLQYMLEKPFDLISDLLRWRDNHHDYRGMIFPVARDFFLTVIAIFLIYYLVLNLKSIENNAHERNLGIISLTLCGGIFLLFLDLFVYAADWYQAHPFGFFIFAVGIVSSAILEWSPKFLPTQ